MGPRTMHEVDPVPGRSIPVACTMTSSTGMGEKAFGTKYTIDLWSIAAEFVRLKVDVILANGTEPAVAAKQATSVIPVVFPSGGRPDR